MSYQGYNTAATDETRAGAFFPKKLPHFIPSAGEKALLEPASAVVLS
jgi:hypothetical protein